MEEYQIRRAVPGDENALARIQTESWKAAFRDILQEDLLSRYTELGRAVNVYQRMLEEGKRNGYLLEVCGSPHCMAFWDATRETDMPGYAELICIHSLQDRWHKGYGSKMMERILQDVRAAGYSRIMLWVFAENYPAIRFYQAHGFAPNGKTKITLGAGEIMLERDL